MTPMLPVARPAIHHFSGQSARKLTCPECIVSVLSSQPCATGREMLQTLKTPPTNNPKQHSASHSDLIWWHFKDNKRSVYFQIFFLWSLPPHPMITLLYMTFDEHRNWIIIMVCQGSLWGPTLYGGGYAGFWWHASAHPSTTASAVTEGVPGLPFSGADHMVSYVYYMGDAVIIAADIGEASADRVITGVWHGGGDYEWLWEWELAGLPAAGV